ncbi:MAG: hypothetical protein LBK47_08190 [Prevotellaceae bacterium]|nr:hypothetical protein [Prevotellaceae bacterium]
MKKIACLAAAAVMLLFASCTSNNYNPFGAVQGEVREQSRYNASGV